MNSETGRSKNALAVKKKRIKLREKAVEYMGGCCNICKYNAYIEAFDFHHIDPKTKAFEISDNPTRAWEKTKIELDKCVLLCANCHIETHAGLTIYSLESDKVNN